MSDIVPNEENRRMPRRWVINESEVNMKKYFLGIGVAAMAGCMSSNAIDAPPVSRPMTLEQILSPYDGPIVEPADNTTIRGKVMTGYQGWFMAEGDGYDRGFVHWGPVDHDPPRCTVDFWPDLSEYDDDELFATNYRHRDGRVAKVFSSTNTKTVVRHFRWMSEYGIDGAFIQRFTSCVSNQDDWNYRRSCKVLRNCRAGANRYGRVFAVMYDTNFDRSAVDAMKADWTRLINEMKLTQTPAYMRHNGAPVVSLWGYGFGHRKFDAEAAEELFEFFKKPENGGCTIMLGVPNDWESWTDDRMRLLKEYATVISPWNVGRYSTVDGAKAHFKKFWPGDIAFCKANGMDYYPVVFPGFSWTNLKKGASKLDQIPRRRGEFLWGQIEQVREYGLDMIYVAMFDEVDEGTAIFKCTNDPPVGRFCTYEGLPSDFYLRVCGQARKLLRGGRAELPQIEPDPKQIGYRPVSVFEYYRNPNRFSPETVKRWKALFAGTAIDLHDGPYSPWAQDLVDSNAVPINVLNWQGILDIEQHGSLLLLATGGEGFNARHIDPKRIADHITAHLKRGGTLVVMSSGRYPMYYPGKGDVAAGFGFRLEMIDDLSNATVSFDETLGTQLPQWQMGKRLSSRLMHPDLYEDAKNYQSLASVRTSRGQYVGDLMACAELGGELAPGRIIYVAGDLLAYPEREALLDCILKLARSALGPQSSGERIAPGNAGGR